MPDPLPSVSMAPPGANDMRRAGREALSLALMDLRNRTLQVLAQFEAAEEAGLRVPQREDTEPPVWIAGHIAWLAESWIARNPQRALGPSCPDDAVRLASIEPMADAWFDPLLLPHAARWEAALPPPEAVRAYLLDTLEGTLELLERSDGGDEGLHFFRMAWMHEALRQEQLLALAQAVALPLRWDLPGGVQPREPLLVPAATWVLGASPDGFVFDIEKWAHEVDVPEFDIDAQPVTWAQFVEFVDDGGYDREDLWSAPGWQWLQQEAGREGRRGPRYVEQIGSASGAVLRSVFGKPARMAGTQACMHVSWWEADAYARWCGRRLPTEIEWEVAVHAATRRGFRWGEVVEWTAGSLRPWPGFRADAWTRGGDFGAAPRFGLAKVLRGASFATPPGLASPKLRRFALPHRDEAFVGFRTCSL